jgi:hypothetical protein
MSGYGFYDEEEETTRQGMISQGIITGAGAIPKRKYVVEMAVSAKTGKRYHIL